MKYLMTLILSTSLGLTSAAFAQNSNLTATAYQTTNVRSGPGTQYEIVGQLAQGESVQVNGRDSRETRWLRVILENEILGWVTLFSVTLEGSLDDLPVIGDSISDEDPGDSAVFVVAYGRVNVRKGPGIIYDVIGQLDVDDEAEVFARSNLQNDWLYVETDNLQGWIAYFTVTITGDISSLPIRVPDSGGQGLVPPSTLVPTRYNVHLRIAPTLNSTIAGIVPFDSPTTPIARTQDQRWIYVLYEDLEGWGMAELFNISDDQLDALPVYSLRPTVTPQPQSTLAVTQEVDNP
jgi:uncharacterized protein YgiM (DUF1202 family)